MLPGSRNPLLPEPLFLQGRKPIYLVRHGQTAWNVERRFLGKSDIPLDTDGHSQARALAERLRFLQISEVYTSPLSRALGTARAVAELQASCVVKMVQDLAELDQGELEGKKGACLPSEYPDFFRAWEEDPTDVRVPGGETMRECQERSWSALHDALAESAADTPLVIVSHKMVICTIICRILGLPLRFFRRIGQANTAINLLSAGDGGLQLHRLNDGEHLNY